MKNTSKNTSTNFFEQNKDLIIAGSAIVVVAGAGFAWYYFKKKKENKQTISKNTITLPTQNRMPVISQRSSTPSKKVKLGYPLQFGSRHKDVKILQGYLKIYKEDLGRTGKKRDGVDGIFGSKTLRAAKKRLGKSVFTSKDIAGMRKALNITIS